MKLKTIKSILATALCAVGLTAVAEEVKPITLGEVTSHETWDGKFDVGYTLAGLVADVDYKVAFDVTANGMTKSVTNAAAKLANGTYTNALDTAELFGKITADKEAEIAVHLIKVESTPTYVETEIGKDGSKKFVLGPLSATVMLPAGIQGYAYVVSNLTANAEVEKVGGGGVGVATYELPIGAKVGIYAIPAEGYVVTGVNPFVIEEVTADTTLEDVTLPMAMKAAAIKITGVVPFYPWSTSVAVDFALADELSGSKLESHKNLTLCATIKKGDRINFDDDRNIATLGTVDVADAALGYGTLVADFADAFPRYRGKVCLWFVLGDEPASELVEVNVDTTATVDPATGAPVYAIENVNDIFPINYSWRFANEKWEYNDPVRLSLGGAFMPVGEQGYSSNEGAADFTPTANGRHEVALMIGQPDEKSHYSKGEFTAFFEVNDPTLAGGSPAAPGKVIRNLESGEGSPRYGSYSTLAEAVAAYEYGDTFSVYGDVQGEDVEIPGGATVILADAAARIRQPQADAARPWLAAAPVRDAAGNIYGYSLGCNGEMVRPKFGPDENGEFFRYEVVDDVTNIVFSVTNTYHGLFYSVDYKLRESDAWMDGALTPGSNGVTYVSSPYLGAEALYSPRVTDDPTVYPPLTYAQNADGTYTVTGVKEGATLSGRLKLPTMRRGRPVTALATAAFKDQAAITGIQLPLTLGEIPDEAFSGCSGLTSFEVPVGVTKIGLGAFKGCSNMAAVVLPATLVEIGREAFANSGLKALALPESLASLDAGALSGCKDLANVAFPANFAKISASAFKGCTSLGPTVTLPAGLQEIGSSAFEGCTSLAYVKIPSACTALGANAFAAATQLEAVYFDGNAPTAEDGVFPAETTLYVKPGATGFGDVPGTWKGCATAVWVDGLEVGQHFVGAIYSNGSLIRTGYCHNPSTMIECRLSDAGDGSADKVVFFGGSTADGTAMGFQTRGSETNQTFYIGGEVISNAVEEGVKFPFEPASGCRWTVDLTCDTNGVRWTSGNSWNADGQLDAAHCNLGQPSEGQDICIFGRNDGTGQPIDGCSVNMTLGWFKIYEGGSLLHDFRPCKDLRTDEVGLFDVIGDKRFRAGANIVALKDPLPELDPKPDADFSNAYTNLDYICVTGAQYACLVESPKADATYRYVGGIDGYAPTDPARYGEGVGSESEPALIKPLLVFEDMKLIRHLIPCERKSDQTKGLYDLVTKAFYKSVNDDAPFGPVPDAEEPGASEE